MRLVRAMAIVVGLTLVGAACGDDGETDAGTDAVPTDDGGTDGGDTSDGGTDTSDDVDLPDVDLDDVDLPDVDLPDVDLDDVDLSQFENCEDIEAAINAAQSSTAADPTQPTDPAQLEADLAESLATIDALRSELPSDLQDDADVIRDAISAVDEAFAEIDYDVSTLDPSAMVEFAQSMLTADTMGMLEATTNITNWVSSGCPR